MKKTALVIMAIVLPLFILLASIELNTFNINAYLESYRNYNTSTVTERSMEELEQITKVFLTYLKEGTDGQVLKPYFNQREIKHMEDVKLLFSYGFILKKILLFLILLILTFIFINKDWRALGITLFYGIIAWWGLFLLLFILSMKDFNKYFTYFHLIFFDNDLWILNPERDLLIQMLPQQFFISIFTRIILLFLFILAIIQIIGYILIKKGKKDYGKISKF